MDDTDTMCPPGAVGRAVFLPLLLLAVVATACATAPPKSPFEVPRESFFPSVKVVALAPVVVPDALKEKDTVRARYEELVEAQLRAAGWKVIRPAEVGPLMKAEADRLGGLYDPSTGEIDPAKRKAFVEALSAQLTSRYSADVFLRSGVRIVAARLSGDEAQWDGIHENAGAGGIWQKLLWSHSGTVPALSFAVRLFRVNGDLLYAKRGGIQVLARVDLGGNYVRLPDSELLADHERIEGSIHRALDELLGTTEGPPSPPPPE